MEKEKVKEMLDVMADAVKTLAKFRGYICECDIVCNRLQLHIFPLSMKELLSTNWKITW